MSADVSLVGQLGVRTDVHFEDGKLLVRRRQRVDGIIDRFREESESINKKALGRVAARIPADTFWRWREEWMQRHSDKWEWPTYLAMKINNPDYKYLRNSKL